MAIQITIKSFIEIIESLSQKLETRSFKESFVEIKNLDFNNFNNELFKDDYNISPVTDILKNENEYNFMGTINEKSEYIYLSRNNLSKYEIKKRKYQFKSNYDRCIENMKFNIIKKINFLNEKKIISEKYQILNFFNKVDYEDFVKSFIDDFSIYKDKLILKVR